MNITLDKLRTGRDAIIRSIECENKALRKHILDMGLTPGVEVTLVKTAPMGDPLELKVRGYALTLRKTDAAKIKISNIHKAHNEKKVVAPFVESDHSQIGETSFITQRDSKTPAKTSVKLALAGNQNSGKTTLFNQLTGSHQHVGNFPGVTVDRTDGIIKNHKNVTITDLPGIYS